MAECAKFSNEATAFLATTIGDGDITIDVTSFADFPAAEPYRIRIDEEIMLVTAGAATLTWTVSRGMEGTTAAPHFAGAEIGNYITVGSMEDFYQCMFMSDVRANRPAPGIAGRLFFAQKPGWYFYRDNGSSWDAWASLFAMFEANNDDFTWINQVTGTISAAVDTGNGGIFITTPPNAGSGDNVRLKTQAVSSQIPTTTPYTVTAAFTPLLYGDNTSCGIVFRDSGTDQFIFFRLLYDTASVLTKRTIAISLDKFDDPNTFNSNYTVLSSGIFTSSLVWFRMEDDGVDLTWYISNDGNNFIEIYTTPRLDFLSTVDEIGFAVNTNNTTTPAGMTLLSWEKTA